MGTFNYTRNDTRSCIPAQLASRIDMAKSWSATSVSISGMTVSVTNANQGGSADPAVQDAINNYSPYDQAAGWSPVDNMLPSGVILPFAGATAPTGWLLCNGASVLRTDYPFLFSIIGTAFGSVDGTHFTLPDLRGRHVLGVDGTHALAASGGAIDHTHAGPGNHLAHIVTQPAAHSNHAVTQPAAHADVLNHVHVENAQGGTTASTTGTHLMTSAATGGLLRAAGQSTANPTSGGVASQAHSGAAVDAHSAHSGAAVDGHSAHGATGANNPPFLALNHIIKV